MKLLLVIEIIGWIFILLFLSALAAAVFNCPPNNCSGDQGLVYVYPFFAFFTILPVGGLMVLGVWIYKYFDKKEKQMKTKIENNLNTRIENGSAG